jgi:hypothetical protein
LRRRDTPCHSFAAATQEPEQPMDKINASDRIITNIATAQFKPFVADGEIVPGQSYLQLDNTFPDGGDFISTAWRRAHRVSRTNIPAMNSFLCSTAR